MFKSPADVASTIPWGDPALARPPPVRHHGNSVAASAAPGTVIVHGTSFTPGGDIYVALYDQWGARLYETRWVTGSSSVYGLNGSLDPASGYDPGGAFSESFEHLCGATAMIRAFDHRTSTWSDWLDLDSDALDCDGPATYLHDQPS